MAKVGKIVKTTKMGKVGKAKEKNRVKSGNKLSKSFYRPKSMLKENNPFKIQKNQKT